MNLLSLNNIIIYTFLIITLLIGFFASRNIKTIKDYIIANRAYGSSIVTMTILATFIGGNNIKSFPKIVFEDGIVNCFFSLIMLGISFLFVGFIVGPKILFFKNCLTMGQIVSEIYGKTIRIVFSIITFIFSILIIASQIIAIGYLGANFLNIKVSYCIWVGGLIVIIYSAIGGIRSVAMTDIFQFIILILVIFAITQIIINKSGNILSLYKNIERTNPEKFYIFKHPKSFDYLTVSIVRYLIPTSLLSPPIVQRILMIQNKNQIHTIFLASGFFILLVRLMIVIIGLGTFLLFPDIDSNNLVLNLIKRMFSPIIQPLLFTGILAIVMSTADSFLNSAGITLAHDILAPMFKKSKLNFNTLISIKIVTFIVGIISILIAIMGSNIYMIIYFACFVMSAIIIPFIGGVLGLKASKKSFYLALFGSVGTVLFLNLLKLDENIIIIISIVINAILFLLMNFIDNKGFVLVNRKIAKNRISELDING